MADDIVRNRDQGQDNRHGGKDPLILRLLGWSVGIVRNVNATYLGEEAFQVAPFSSNSPHRFMNRNVPGAIGIVRAWAKITSTALLCPVGTQAR